MVRELLRKASEKFTLSESPMLDARVLLAYAMGKENAAMIFDLPDERQLALFNSYVEKRASGVPVAYILGEKEFMGLKFFLNENTLIPRPDTECLVEKVIEIVSPNPRILDLCTGSGCIGISLAKFIPDAVCALTDISEGALEMARKNAVANGVSERTSLSSLDVLTDAFPVGYDIIVSNPPYIERGVVPTLEVSMYEPTLALDGGEDGLDFYRVIADKAYNALSDGGILALEIGYDQGESVKNLLCKFSEVNIYKDYGNNDRVVIAKRSVPFH